MLCEYNTYLNRNQDTLPTNNTVRRLLLSLYSQNYVQHLKYEAEAVVRSNYLGELRSS